MPRNDPTPHDPGQLTVFCKGKPRWVHRPGRHIWQRSGLQDIDVLGSRNRGSSGIRLFQIILETNKVRIMITLFGLPHVLSLQEIVKHHRGKELNTIAAQDIGGQTAT